MPATQTREDLDRETYELFIANGRSVPATVKAGNAARNTVRARVARHEARMTSGAVDPRIVDEKLAELHGQLAKAEGRLSSLRRSIIDASGARYYYRGRQRVTDRTYDEAVAICRKAIAEKNYAALISYGFDRTSERLDTEIPAAQAEVARIDAAIDVEAAKYTGWSRFFLVTSSPGHVHRSMHCSTCRPTTTYGWLPQLSGKTEAVAVAELGPTLCSVCFPSAPLDWTTGKKLTAAQAAKKAA